MNHEIKEKSAVQELEALWKKFFLMLEVHATYEDTIVFPWVESMKQGATQEAEGQHHILHPLVDKINATVEVCSLFGLNHIRNSRK
jgi:hypothetical protein